MPMQILPLAKTRVTWIWPEENKVEELFIKKEMRRYGRRGLVVHSTRKIGEQIFVALTKNNELLMEQPDKPLEVNWRFLRLV